MKTYFSLLLILFLTTLFAGSAYASTSPTPTPSQPLNGLEQQITNLKDKIASSVASLNLVEKRGAIGNVTDVSATQITMNDLQGNTQFVDVDELTKFTSQSSATFGISDLTKGMKIGVLGLYNKDSKRILARFVDVLSTPLYFSGAVSNIDKTNYDLTVVSQNNSFYTIDVEVTTKTSSYDPTDGLKRSGFSKIAIGERIVVIGFPSTTVSKEIVASRMILFPTLPINPLILSKNPQLNTTTPAPATPSGK